MYSDDPTPDDPIPGPELRIRPEPRTPPGPVSAQGLQAEIQMLRTLIRRVFSAAGESDMKIEDWTAVLNALGSASTRLASLLKAQQVIGADQTRNALARAIAEVAQEMRLHER
jgi:hypothetical protein